MAGGRAPQPVIREPRCTRWLVAEVRAFWVARAQALLEELVGGVFLDADRLIPLARGMALAQERVRPRIPRGEADRIVRELVAAATAINARTGARVFVERLEVFGSYLSDRADLGDVDVIAIIPLPDDCIPEDMEERDEVSASLQVSDYVSLTDEFDHVAAGADKEVIFIRDPEWRRHRWGSLCPPASFAHPTARAGRPPGQTA